MTRVPFEHPATWPTIRLRDIALKIGSGATPLGGDAAYLASRVRYALVRSQNVFDRRFDATGLAFISDAQAERLKGALLREQDLLLNITGDGVTFSRACMVPQSALPACVNQHVAIVRVDPTKADAGFVLSYLTHPMVKPYIEGFNAGGSRRAITKGHIENFVLPLPPIDVQRAIGSFLQALDDKIDLNRRMNETLDAMARAIFKDWFVDFGPTRAKMEGRAPYLAPDLWSLFPDRLDDEGKPEGWEICPLDQTARFLNGLALQKYPAEGDDALPVIKIAQLRAGRTSRDEMASASIPADYIVRDGDLLFSWSGSLLHRIWSGGAGALNQHLFKVMPNGVPQWFVFEWIAEHMESFRAIAASKATTMGHIQRHHLAEATVCMPSPTVMAAADSLIAPQYEKMLANELEARTLAATRDLLLPRLMSGELRVRDAEAAVVRAA